MFPQGGDAHMVDAVAAVREADDTCMRPEPPLRKVLLHPRRAPRSTGHTTVH